MIRKQKKYLLEIHHGIGDIVQYTGLIKSIKNYEPDAYIGMILNKDAYKKLFKLDQNIDDIHIVDFSGNKKHVIKNILEIRKQKYDYMICSGHSRQKSMEFMAVAFGAKQVVGNKLMRLEKISKHFINVTVDLKSHVVKQNFEVLRGLGKPYEFFDPYLVYDSPPIKLQKKAIGLCIGTSIPQKTWDIKKFISIGEHFSAMGYSIVLLGGKEEAKAFKKSGYNNENWVNLLGKTDLNESASECSGCCLIIGGDTGLMHMAAAVGTTTLTLFSCSEPLTHAPYSSRSYFFWVQKECQFCFGTEKMKKCQSYDCIKEIQTEKIIKIAESILTDGKYAQKYKFLLN